MHHQLERTFVIDAAERLSGDGVRKTTAFITDLLGRKGTEGKVGWRVVIVGQTEAWVSGHLQKLTSIELPPNFELKALSDSEARQAMLATTGISWLASHDDAVAALTNLRALAWVIDAAPRFASQSGARLSLTAIADRLWSYWTNDKPDAQRLLMRLSEREALRTQFRTE